MKMQQYKKDFIEFMVESNVLTFGDFVTKSGRKTPFFVNTGNYKTGKQLKSRGTLRFLPQLEMRPSSNAPSPVESREAPPTSSFPGFSEPP